MSTMNNRFTAMVIVLAGMTLSGCAATQVAISKRNLDVQTKMSQSIFMDPVPDGQKTIYLQMRNTSDKPGLKIEEGVREKLVSRGYRLVKDAGQAHYLLQVNILQAGMTDPSSAMQSLSSGFGGAVIGATVAAASGNYDTRGATMGALIGAAVGVVSDALVKDVTYSLITDVQVSERGAVKDGWQRYQTRILSMANKVNLEFAEAQPALIQGLVQSVSGLF